MSMNIDKYYWYELTRNLQPIETANSLHVYSEVYKVGAEKVSLFWNISGNTIEPNEIEIEPWEEKPLKRTMIKDLSEKIDQKVLLKGWVSQWRELKKMSFVILRDRTGYSQIIVPKDLCKSLSPESVIEVVGVVKATTQSKDYNVEVNVEKFTIVSEAEVLPFPIYREDDIPPFHTLNQFRPLTLRKEKERCIFTIQSVVINAYREYLLSQGFTEINSTKLSAAGLEGGADMFEIDYFGHPMYLTQSPQFYKQMMVGVFERVFEVGKVYRAEGSNTNKHLSEFIGFDFEMGFINSVEEVMDMEENVLNYIFSKVLYCSKELEYLNIGLKRWNQLKFFKTFPRITYNDAVEIIKTEFGYEVPGVGLNTEAEKLICEYAKTKYDSDFVFITKYPLSERPFYAMPSENGVDSETFELLYKGTEITSGGERISNYNDLVSAIKSKNLNPDNFESYLIPFKYGMPSHGGCGIGCERLIMKMLNLNTAEECSLIPRTKDKFIH